MPTASPTTPPWLSWLGFLDDSEYFRLIMIGQTSRQCPGKLSSDDQTLKTVNLRYMVFFSVETQNKNHEFECWKPEFIRETVWTPGQLRGDVVMFMFVTTDSVTTDSALPRGDCLQLLTGPW